MLKIHIINNKNRDAIGKNKLLKASKDADYIFLVNDYVKVLDPTVYARFVLTSQQTGFECMGLASYEPMNKEPIFVKDPFVDYWAFPSSDFLFLTQNAIQKAGYLDEGFPSNTWEDVEHIKRIGDKALTAPFGMFIGIKNERKYLWVDEKIKRKQTEEDMKRNDLFKKATDFWIGLDPTGFPEMPKEKKGLELKKAEGEMI